MRCIAVIGFFQGNDHEGEISRLTWAVLDSKATETERRRLAELAHT